MFIVITEEKCVGPFPDEFHALMGALDSWKEFNPNGLDEFLLQVVWSNDQVSFHYIDY